MNREVLWRFNYKFPLVGFRLIAPLVCLPRALPFSLSPATSKRLLQAPATQAIVLERKKEKTKQQQKNLAIICLVCGFHLAYCCVSQCFLERENNFEFILLVLFLSEFFFLCFLWQSFRLSTSVYPVLFRLTASPCLYLMSFRIAIIRCSSSLDYVCTRIFWLFKQMCQ